MKIIIQAGGKGTRLEGLTRNRPKCLVPVNNLPIIFYTLKKFPDAEFYIITDYKTEVLEKYLKAFAEGYKYKIIKTDKKGTVSGINNALNNFTSEEKVTILWCDLILSPDFKIPTDDENYLGISKDFECRWSYKENEFVKEPSKKDGVAGLFIFKNKSQLIGLPEEGALVPWLKAKEFCFKCIDLTGTKEIGTLLSYSENNNDIRRWRPFNSMKFIGDIVIKDGINEQGKKIAIDERNWYKFVKEKGFEFIPEIYEYEPLKMKKVQGKNIYDYDCLTKTQKEEILLNIINALEKLHNLVPPITANDKDSEITYITKTFERLEKVKDLVPFANKEFIKINSHYYKNVFFDKEKFVNILESLFPKKFHLIHGDCTFSNLMFDTFNMKTILIDPRGYFGTSKLYGDIDYDWAKLYYSIKGNYDQFNRKKFTLDIKNNEVELAIKTNGWEDMEEFFFDNIKDVDKNKIKILHSVIWLSLTTYAWEDYDSICGAFYNGVIQIGGLL